MNKLARTIALALMLVTAVSLTGGSATGQVDDPSTARPRVTVATAEYEDRNVAVPNIAYPVDVWAKVWYPAGLPAGPYPLILFLHGNHGVCRQPVPVGTPPDPREDRCVPDPPNCPLPGPASAGFTARTPNHLGYEYIAERLASWGYIVASINANAINCRAGNIAERGRLVQEHLRRWQQWNSPAGRAPFATRFSGRVDLNNVGLAGHSRGGEGVLAAYNLNRADGSPFGITAVFEIGPTDGRVFNADGVNFSVLLPGCDADVDNNEGMQIFDRAQARSDNPPTPKAQQFIWGANHNFFNSVWLPEPNRCTGQTLLTRAQQEQVGRVYTMGFFRTFIGAEAFADLFTRDLAPPASVATTVDNAYTESPELILTVDDFTDLFSPWVSTLGDLNFSNRIDVTTCDGAGCSASTWEHDPVKHAARISWPTAGTGTPSFSLYLSNADGSPLNISDYTFLSFRVAEQDDPANPANPGVQNFMIHMVDAAWNLPNPIAVADYRAIHFPVGSSSQQAPIVPNRKSVLETVRIPLDDFGVDLTQVTQLDFVFNREAQGAIFLSDIHFSP